MPVLHFYLTDHALGRIGAGERTMQARLKAAVEAAGWTVRLHPEALRFGAPGRAGFHLVVNQAVEGDKCLTLRAAGFEPFWQLERTNDRWDWQVAARPYTPPADVTEARLAEFIAQWRRHVLGGLQPASGCGIFVPLQGGLLKKKPHQSASAAVMLSAVLARWPGRRVTATLHPKVLYREDEREVLAALARSHANLTVQEGGSDTALAACDLVVTQNSTMALKGFLIGKPAMIWAGIDWHHIAASVPRMGAEAAFDMAETAGKPDFARYLFWYCRRQSLFGWDDGVAGAIRWRLGQLGWPIK